MKPELLNNGLQPPERTERDTDGQLQDLLEWVRKTYKPSDFWDMYEHDREVAIRFAEWCGYNYTRLNDGTWRKRGGGWNKKTAKGIAVWTTKTLWDVYCTQTKQ